MNVCVFVCVCVFFFFLRVVLFVGRGLAMGSPRPRLRTDCVLDQEVEKAAKALQKGCRETGEYDDDDNDDNNNNVNWSVQTADRNLCFKSKKKKKKTRAVQLICNLPAVWFTFPSHLFVLLSDIMAVRSCIRELAEVYMRTDA
jgi:hypothetical protein